MRTLPGGHPHPWNLVVDATCTRVVGLLDLECAGTGDHHFDLRYLPALAPTLDLDGGGGGQVATVAG